MSFLTKIFFSNSVSCLLLDISNFEEALTITILTILYIKKGRINLIVWAQTVTKSLLVKARKYMNIEYFYLYEFFNWPLQRANTPSLSCIGIGKLSSFQWAVHNPVLLWLGRGTCCGSKVPCRELYSRFLSFKDHISTITGPTKGHDKLLNYWKWCILYQGLFDICFDFKEIAHVRWP